MSDYIKREDVFKAIAWRAQELTRYPTLWQQAEDVHGIKQLIERIPPADVVERKCGTYTDTDGNYEWYARMHTCDLCERSWMGDTNFCPNCGADMRGGGDE